MNCFRPRPRVSFEETRLSASRPRAGRGGFALLVTIVLVSFLVLILVGLASFTRVETQVAANSQQLAQARQNALMALNVALGQLQQAAGPDQRVTARAEILDSASTTPSIDDVKQPYWTAVWKTGSETLDTGANPQRVTSLGSLNPNVTEKNTTANWLVSKPPASVVTPISTALTVSDDLTGADLSAAALQSGISTENSSTTLPTAVILAKKIGRKDPLLDPNNATNPGYIIAAPLVDIKANPTGLATDQTVGRYGFWVSDEGVKAKINLVPNDASGDPVSNSSNRAKNQLHYISPATMAAEQSLDPTFRMVFPVGDADKLRKIIQTSATGLVISDNFLSDSKGMLLSHPDITTYSSGVIADVRNGGLKKDLTAALENQNQFSTLMNSYTVSNDGAGNKVWVIPGVSSVNPGVSSLTLDGLRWQSLWYHYNIYKAVMPSFRGTPVPVGNAPKGIGDPNSVSLSIDPRIYVNSNGASTSYSIDAIAPSILAIKLEVGISTVRIGTSYQIRLHYFPTMVMHNPYNVKLNGGGVQYMIQANPFGVGASNDFCVITRSSDSKQFYNDNLLYRSAIGGTPGTGNFVAMFYTNSSDSSFEPGEVKIFGLDQSIAVNNLNLLNFSNANIRTAAYTFTGQNATRALSSSFASGNSQYVDFPLPAGATLSAGDILKIEIPKRVRANVFNYGARSLSRWPDANPNTTYPNDYSSQTMFTANNVLGLSQLYDTGEGATKQTIFNDRVDSFDPSNPGGSLKTIGAVIIRVKGRSPTTNSVAAPLHGGAGAAFNSTNISQSTALMDVDNLTGVGFVGSRDIQRDPTNSTRSLWGFSDAGRLGGSSRYVLKELPIQPMLSLGQFMHATLGYFHSSSNTNVTKNNFSLYPVGGSYANPLIANLASTSKRVINGNAAYNGLDIDDQYLNNEALFDTFFFSTIPPDLVANPLPTGTVTPQGWSAFNQNSIINGSVLLNPRHKFVNKSDGTPPDLAQLREFNKAAGGLLIDGAFNVNSTSIPAWRALLASLRFASKRTDKHPWPRITTALTAVPDTNDLENGIRVLTDDQIDKLARAIVENVKLRGPFLSMADFVNRRLVNNSFGVKGALQSAIESSGINNEVISNSGLGNVDTKFSFPIGFGDTTGAPSFILANSPAKTAEMAPGCISQADLLQALAPVMTVRSDTFTIRTYGEVRNPLLGNAKEAVTGRAWCEAVVQRYPEYVTPKSGTNGNDAYEIPNPNSDNANFGRRFKIISFRWLNSNEI